MVFLPMFQPMSQPMSALVAPLPLLIAAALAVCVGIAHSVLGEWKLIQPLIAPETRTGLLAKSGWFRNVLRFAWHLTTIAWWGFAALLVILSGADPSTAVRGALAVTSVTFLITGLVTLVISRGTHLAWPVFMAIAALSAVPLWQ